MGNLDRKAYDAEIQCLAILPAQSSVFAHRVITTTVAAMVVANKGVHFLMPFISTELMMSPPNTLNSELPEAPTPSTDYQTDVRIKCKREWMYFLHLLQYWYDTSTVYTYGGPVRQESKLMLYVFYRINAILNLYGIYIHLHDVMDNTPWWHYYEECIRLEDHVEDYESQRHIIKGLDILHNWLRNHYLVEATAEWRHLTLHGGSLDKMPFPHSYEDQQPGNKGPFYQNRGIRPEEEPVPCIANATLEVLAQHNHQQAEARDRQKYQWQQDNTESLVADFPSFTLVEREEPMNLEGLEATTAAPPLPNTTMPAQTKKITI